jgi:hypothetical protein
MTYTINGKEYTKRAINLRCAELMGITCHKSEEGGHAMIKDLSTPNLRWIRYVEYDPCNNPAKTDAIIDKCWDELMKLTETFDDGIADGLCTRWEYLMNYDNCTKLVAACICYIEINEAAL